MIDWYEPEEISAAMNQRSNNTETRTALRLRIDDFAEAEWTAQAANFLDHSVYQTWAYQEARAEFDRQRMSRFMVLDGDTVVAMAQMRIKSIPLIKLGVGYIQWGPLMRHRAGLTASSADIYTAIKDAYLGKLISVLRIQSCVPDDEDGQENLSALQSSGFELAPQNKPYHTILIPVDRADEEIQAAFSRSWKRNLKKALKRGLTVEMGKGHEHLATFDRLYKDAIARKGFAGLDPSALYRVQERADEAEKPNIIVVSLDGEPVTVLIGSYLGDTAMDLLAANNDKALACGSSYVAYWHAFRAARDAGMSRYDIGGIDAKGNPNVFEFKRRTGGVQQLFIGVVDAFQGGLVRRIFYLTEGLKKKLAR